MTLRRCIWILLTASALLAAPSLAQAQRPRPDEVVPAQVVTAVAPDGLSVYNDYATSARTYASRQALVHYVVLGVDAPPLNDDDGDGVPDYVERVGDAADTAIAYYERRGFVPITRDQGGPDTRPDLYVTRFTPGCFGLSIPASDAVGGAFVAISNSLDPSPERSLGSLYGTVAHEVFHLVQFSYFLPAQGAPLPDWVLEGMAAAAEDSVYPELADIVSTLQLRSWFAAPQITLTAQSYGAQLLWRYLERHDPHVMPAFLASVARSRPSSFAARLAVVYRDVALQSFASAFTDFATWVAENDGRQITPLESLPPGGRATGRAAPFAIHYLRLPRDTRSVTLRFAHAAAGAELMVERGSEYAGRPPTSRRLRGRFLGGAIVFTIPARLRHDARLDRLTLVIANGRASGTAAYSLSLARGTGAATAGRRRLEASPRP
jgi:hypothetical protein